ncbi:MAG: P27 family phage terminase small subunit [Cellulosilyticum sp.]|nr:P27 family phage terminase small subunit [Cellulosilyticum sp.]
MARPTKAVVTLDKYGQTKQELSKRLDNETKLKGGSKNILPPGHLNANQKKIFNYIVKSLEQANILGDLDVYILTTCSIAIDRLEKIEAAINDDFNLLYDAKFMASKEKYTKDLYRCCNELSLSPQARAKMGNAMMQNNSSGPSLKEILGG